MGNSSLLAGLSTNSDGLWLSTNPTNYHTNYCSTFFYQISRFFLHSPLTFSGLWLCTRSGYNLPPFTHPLFIYADIPELRGILCSLVICSGPHRRQSQSDSRTQSLSGPFFHSSLKTIFLKIFSYILQQGTTILAFPNFSCMQEFPWIFIHNLWGCGATLFPEFLVE